MTSSAPGAAEPAAPTGPDGAPEAATPEELAAQWDAEKPEPAGVVTNAVIALLVIGFGLAGVLGSWALGAGSLGSPGPGTWPLVISSAITLLGLVLLLQARATDDTERFTSESWVIVPAVLSLVPFAYLIEVIGFEIPSAALAFVWLKFLGREAWRTSVVGALLMVAAFYGIFVVALRVSIPHLF
ncbi:tripartite tricarboxylate transporter TctB family protein [Nocardioides zeae]|uniref:Tripartite tricarboxylate transporter TctB family protein n=1 Tax=Nocardioides imazamoxiresistens TaxID=3231893 RepID=A0ABU3PS94_9ACTN|nr:tripartite tricarboxylate transporter TctB family protein [Nocardioides zeae]MDT9592087.1 tripartite tricarboxylate transporter TctB family protein [Nocardioides zeae]